MEFVICNRENAPFIKPELPYLRISFLNPESSHLEITENPNSFIAGVQLKFDDADIAAPNIILFDRVHARRILWLIETNKQKVKVVVVNCEAGLSRSAGCAAALSYIYCGSDVDIVNKKPFYNKLVYRTIINTYYCK